MRRLGTAVRPGSRLALLLAGTCAALLAAASAPAQQAWYTDPSFVRSRDAVVAIEHVTVIDGTGAAPRLDRTVIVDHDHIASVGPSATAGAIRVDGRGRTLLPGLVGMHEHLFTPVPVAGPPIGLDQLSFPALYLASGVTTARTSPDGDLDGARKPDTCESSGQVGRAAVAHEITATTPVDDPRLAELIRLMIARRVPLTSTLAVLEGGSRLDLAANPRLRALAHPLLWARINALRAAELKDDASIQARLTRRWRSSGASSRRAAC